MTVISISGYGSPHILDLIAYSLYKYCGYESIDRSGHPSLDYRTYIHSREFFWASVPIAPTLTRRMIAMMLSGLFVGPMLFYIVSCADRIRVVNIRKLTFVRARGRGGGSKGPPHSTELSIYGLTTFLFAHSGDIRIGLHECRFRGRICHTRALRISSRTLVFISDTKSPLAHRWKALNDRWMKQGNVVK